MKIAFFTEVYLPILNGVVVSIQTYRKALEDSGHEVFIFTPGFKHVEKEKNVFRFYSAPYPSKTDYRLCFPYPSSVFRSLYDIQPDIIHTHTPFFTGYYGRNASRKLKVPFVFTFHTQYWEYAHYIPLPQKPVRRAAMNWSRVFCNWCDGIVAPSRKIKEVLQELNVSPPIETIPTGIFPDEIINARDERVLEKYKIPQNKFLLMATGRLAKEKNFSFLLSALAPLLQENAGAHLVVIGGGPEEEPLKHLRRELLMDERVTFTGQLPKKEVLKILHHGSLFVFASKTETQGIVILEAMAAGLPVVALKATGVDEVVENGKQGYLCEESPELFREKVSSLLNSDEKRKGMSAAAQEKAKLYSADVLSKTLVSFYESLRRNIKRTA